MAGINHSRPHFGVQPHLIAYPYRLPLWKDSVRAVHVAAHEILEQVITVEAATALAKLRDPRPAVHCWPVNGDAPRCADGPDTQGRRTCALVHDGAHLRLRFDVSARQRLQAGIERWAHLHGFYSRGGVTTLAWLRCGRYVWRVYAPRILLLGTGVHHRHHGPVTHGWPHRTVWSQPRRR
jgi:hypothetical protein